MKCNCSRGGSCKFAHPHGCNFFAAGNRSKGDARIFRHLQQSNGAASSQSNTASANPKAKTHHTNKTIFSGSYGDEGEQQQQQTKDTNKSGNGAVALPVKFGIATAYACARSASGLAIVADLSNSRAGVTSN